MTGVRLVSFVAAEGVSIDQLTGRLTAFNMLDNVALANLPSVVLRITTVSFYELGTEPAAFTERVRLLDPKGEMVTSSQTALAFQARALGELPNGHRSIHVLWRIPLQTTGDYRIVLERQMPGADNWDELTSLCVTATIQPNPVYNQQAPFSVPPPSVPPHRE